MTEKTKNYIRCALAIILYVLFVIWLQSYVWMVGVVIIFDIYISGKIEGAWIKFMGKNVENKAYKRTMKILGDIFIPLIGVAYIHLYLFQLYAIPTSSLEKTLLVGDRLFVSKFHFGPRVPNTPLSLPLVHNVIPWINTDSYVEWVKWPYKRLSGLTDIERNDIVVFNFPAGDTIIVGKENPDYYRFVRELGRDLIWKHEEVKYRPVDKRENWVKRCVGMPGDTLEVIMGSVYINGTKEPERDGLQFNYTLKNNGFPLNPSVFERNHVALEDQRLITNEHGNAVSPDWYYIPLTRSAYNNLKKLPTVTSCQITKKEKGYDSQIFPFSSKYKWNKDYFGPLWIPKAGSSIELNIDNLPLYERIISVYENNLLEVKGDEIFINNEPANSYTFKMNYYWMMGDNRDNSADCRMWGFVPEDHIVGTPLFVFFSLDKDKSFPSSIRWDRVLKWVRGI